MSDAPQQPPGWAAPPPPPSTPSTPPPPTSPGWAAPTTPAAPPPYQQPPPPTTGFGGFPPPPGSGLPPPPAGTIAYGYGYTATPLGVAKPLAGIATALQVLLGLAALTSLGVAAALANRASVLDGDVFSLDFQEVDDADSLATGTAGIYLLLFVVCGVLWLIWQFRHAKNAEALGQRDGLGPGWAIGGWFIPLAMLVLGPLQLQQSAKASDPEATPGQGRTPGILVAWWAVFVGQNLIGLASGRFGVNEGIGDSADLEDFRSADQIGSFGALLTFVAAVLAILMVRSLTQRQAQALAQRGMAS